MHYYQFNIADYRKDTQHLSPMEHYIYRELLDWYYLDEKPIPKKTDSVLRRLRLGSDSQNELEGVLQEFFLDCDYGWSHKRVDHEIAKYHARADTAKANGSKGGRPKKPRKTQPVISGNPSKTQSKANQELRTSNQQPSKESGASPRFSPPSVDAVSDYIAENQLPVDPVRFVDFYESKGWMVGKNKMKDWKAAIRTWSKRTEQPNNASGGNSGSTRKASIQDDLTDTSWAY